MNRFISFAKSIRLRQVISVFILAAAFFVVQAFSYGYQFQAQAAESTTPEAESYNIGDTSVKVKSKNNDENSGIKNTIDNVVEKLNLKEPVPQSTKDFVKEVQENPGEIIGDAVKGPKGAYEDYNKVRGTR